MGSVLDELKNQAMSGRIDGSRLVENALTNAVVNAVTRPQKKPVPETVNETYEQKKARIKRECEIYGHEWMTARDCKWKFKNREISESGFMLQKCRHCGEYRDAVKESCCPAGEEVCQIFFKAPIVNYKGMAGDIVGECKVTAFLNEIVMEEDRESLKTKRGDHVVAGEIEKIEFEKYYNFPKDVKDEDITVKIGFYEKSVEKDGKMICFIGINDPEFNTYFIPQAGHVVFIRDINSLPHFGLQASIED